MVTHILCHLRHVGRHRRHGGRRVRQLRRGRVVRQVLADEVVAGVVQRVLSALRVPYGVVRSGHVPLRGARLSARLRHSRLGQHRL